MEKKILKLRLYIRYINYMVKNKAIVWFDEVDKDDIGLVGGKGANLGEMTAAGFPVPFGFIVTSRSYFQFLQQARIESKIKQTLSLVNFDNPSDLDQASNHIKSLIMDSPVHPEFVGKVTEYYDNLLEKEESYFSRKFNLVEQGLQKIAHLYKKPLVAVRSSATAEDLPTASFAGQQETFLNVSGESHLVHKIKECWASLFTQRAIFYRHQNGFDHFKVGLAAVVQRMIQSDVSGIAFSIDPVTNDKTKIVIEAIFGLGEYIVGGRVSPDHYEVAKHSFTLIKNEVKFQPIKLVESGLANKEIKMAKKAGSLQKLPDEAIVKLALLVSDIEKHYFFPQDIEWAYEKGRLYIVQSRPITTIKQVADKEAELNSLAQVKPILEGSPASPGIGFGIPNVIFSPKEIGKIKKGDVLVAPQTNPDYVQAMKKAAAIVTEKGGRTSHAAIVSRELGIPAVVGAEGATKILRREKTISVNGSTGEIYRGNILHFSKTSSKISVAAKESPRHLKTITKVYVNLAEPDQADKIASQDVDGVGLLRAEFMVAQIGVHPKLFIKQKKEHLFVRKLTSGLLKFAKAFNPRPVVYRATDFRTNEYRDLTGGAEFEPKEENPMLGFRGAARYIANPEVFELELSALLNIYSLGFNNIQLMIPFIRVPWELMRIKELIVKSGLSAKPNFKLWIMAEVPSCALNLEEYVKIGIDGVSIGTNDLTMMLLGVDRDNAEVANIYDERNPVVAKTLEYIVTTCKNNNITCSICGQAASDYPQIVESLVRLGVTSVSVNPDAIVRTRKMIFEIEKKHFSK